MAAVCLGEGTYEVRFLTRRTRVRPARPIGEARVLSGSWGRELNSTTDSSLVFGLTGGEGRKCGEILRKLDPWRDEVEVYRDGLLVWVGPVMDVLANPDDGTATVTAKDLSIWWAKRVLALLLVSRAEDLAAIFARYIEVAFATDDPGIIVEVSPTGIVGDRTIAASDVKRLDVELGELTRSGVDWTVANRVFYVGGQEVTADRLAGRLVDEHFRKTPTTRRSGGAMVNDAYVRGNKVVGHYGGPDPTDGVLLQDVTDENSIEDQGSANGSARSWWDLGHEPLAFLEGDNALHPTAPIRMEELIAGLIVGVDVTGGGVVPLRQDLRLQKLAVSFGKDEETVTVGLQPVGTIIGEES